MSVERSEAARHPDHDWEPTALNGDGGTGNRFEWVCRACGHRSWSDSLDGPDPHDPDVPCAVPVSSSESAGVQGKTQATVVHRTGSYTVVVEDTEDGTTRFALLVSHPPQGLSREVYSFEGRLPSVASEDRRVG